MPEWTLVSNHGLVLTYIAKHVQSTAREIASAIKITEWTVCQSRRPASSPRLEASVEAAHCG